MMDAVCSALNVPKPQVCIMAGDRRSEEGKFSKTIIYYKMAGVSLNPDILYYNYCNVNIIMIFLCLAFLRSNMCKIWISWSDTCDAFLF